MKRLRDLLRAFIRKVQAGVMFVLLVFLYLVGFGVTYVLALVFSRRLLKPAPAGEHTFWTVAEGYEADKEGALRQT